MSLCARLITASAILAVAGAIASQLSGLAGFVSGVGATSLILIVAVPPKEVRP